MTFGSLLGKKCVWVAKNRDFWGRGSLFRQKGGHLGQNRDFELRGIVSRRSPGVDRQKDEHYRFWDFFLEKRGTWNWVTRRLILGGPKIGIFVTKGQGFGGFGGFGWSKSGFWRFWVFLWQKGGPYRGKTPIYVGCFWQKSDLFWYIWGQKSDFWGSWGVLFVTKSGHFGGTLWANVPLEWW
jgi:hypothetical protein